MKRLVRNPEKFEVIDLFTALGRDRNYRLKVDENIEDFMSRVRASLKASMDNPTLLHGKRVEALFPHVAGALGQCALIKQEDSGAMFSNNPDIQAPDFAITLKDGRRLLIEVKNCNFGNPKSPYGFKKEYMESLESYAKLQGAELKFAIYFSRINKWCLVSKESLIEQKNRYVTTMITAMAQNEMAILGDRMLAVIPNIALELIADPSKESLITPDDQASFTISDVRLYSGDVEIVEPVEKNLAFYLTRFSKLTTDTPNVILEDEKLVGVRYEFYSENENVEDQPFTIVGDLSSMVSTAYGEHTVYERSVIALDTNIDPFIFSVEIPEDYKSHQLSLWQFIMQPNPDFQMSQ